MIRLYKRIRQKIRIKIIKKQLVSLTWNMQFEELTPKEIKDHIKKINELRILLSIEEGLYEYYCL